MLRAIERFHLQKQRLFQGPDKEVWHGGYGNDRDVWRTYMAIKWKVMPRLCVRCPKPFEGGGYNFMMCLGETSES